VTVATFFADQAVKEARARATKSEKSPSRGFLEAG
jgi:hypothetical protein